MINIDNYQIQFEKIKIKISINSDEIGYNKLYDVEIVEVSKYTRFLIKEIKQEILYEGIFDKITEEEHSYSNLKKILVKKLEELIKSYFPNIMENDKNKLITYIIQKSLDLGFVDVLICDDNIEEIVINGKGVNVKIYHKKYGWLDTNLNFLSENEIKIISSRIASENKKNFSTLYPLLDAHLRGGHRVNATLSPISTNGNTITIRRFADKPWTIYDMIKNKTSSCEVLALIWMAIENEFSVLITGGTGSGKTSYLNSITSFIPKEQRIISVEDTREISLSKFSHWVPMEARQKNQEGKGEITILDLIINSLRMRPDRIIIGEIRRKEEAQVLFEAMRTGHSVYGTFHANTASETILRLTSPPIEIPKITLNAIGLIVVQYRNRQTSKRYTLQVSEVDENGNENVILQYNPKKKEYIEINEPVAILKRLKEFQAIEKEEFKKDIENKIEILNYITNKNISTLEEIGKVVNLFYKNKNKSLI